MDENLHSSSASRSFKTLNVKYWIILLKLHEASSEKKFRNKHGGHDLFSKYVCSLSHSFIRVDLLCLFALYHYYSKTRPKLRKSLLFSIHSYQVKCTPKLTQKDRAYIWTEHRQLHFLECELHCFWVHLCECRELETVFVGKYYLSVPRAIS